MSPRMNLEAAMIQCLRLWEQTRDVNACVDLFPQYESDIRQHFAFAGALGSVRVPPARDFRRQAGWLDLSEHFFDAQRPVLPVLRYAGMFAAIVLGIFAVTAAGAASNAFEPPSPVSRIFDRLETIPNFIGVTDAPIVVPATPTPSPSPTVTPSPTPVAPTVTPLPAVSPVVPVPLVVPAQPAPQVIPAPERPSAPSPQPQPSSAVPPRNRNRNPTATPLTPTRTPEPMPTPSPTLIVPQPTAPPGNSGNAPGQNAPPANPPGNSNAGGNGNGNGNGQTKKP